MHFYFSSALNQFSTKLHIFAELSVSNLPKTCLYFYFSSYSFNPVSKSIMLIVSSLKLFPFAGSSLPASSSLPSTSYRSYSATGSSVDERASVMERANKLADRLDSLRRRQVS